jgi:cyclic pyranopterin phosphate synthase
MPGPEEPSAQLSHVDAGGHVRMVDVSEKVETLREAIARARVRLQPQTLALIEQNQIAKGNVLEVARIAAIMAAKATPQLIPLCHPLPLTHVGVTFELKREQGLILIETSARTTYKTGVEVEALTAATVAALTIYDMCKAVDHTITLEQAYVARKSGGQHGLVEFSPEPEALAP